MQRHEWSVIPGCSKHFGALELKVGVRRFVCPLGDVRHVSVRKLEWAIKALLEMSE